MERKETGQVVTDKELGIVYSMFTNSGLVADYENGGLVMDEEQEPLRLTVNDLLVKTDLTRFGMSLVA